MDSEKNLVMVKEFAFKEGVNPNTVRNWIKQGLLKAEKRMINSKSCYVFDIDDALNVINMQKSKKYKPLKHYSQTEMETFFDAGRETSRRYYHRHKDKVKSYKKENSEHIKNYRSQYYTLNREKLLEQAKSYNCAHKDEISAKRKAKYKIKSKGKRAYHPFKETIRSHFFNDNDDEKK